VKYSSVSSTKTGKKTGKIGNTSQSSPARYWCFTLNNYTIDDIENIKNVPKEIVPRYVFQEETGDPEETNAGTPHLQGFIDFGLNCKKRPMHMFFKILKHKRTHWEKTRNVEASIEYCRKEKTRTGLTFLRGIEEIYKVDIELKQWQQEICEIIEKPADDRSIIYCWDASGCVGKTTFGKYLYTKYERVVVLGGCKTDMLNGIIQYKKNMGVLPKIVIINIPRASFSQCSWAGVETIKDMFFFSPKYESGMICGPNPHVIVFANFEYPCTKLSEDRWITIKATE